MNENKIITIVGGSGFLGRSVVKLLADAGYMLRVIVRDTEAASLLKPAGNVGQIVIEYGNLAKPQTLEGKLAGSFAVINLVGLLFEKGSQRFTAIHTQGPEMLAKAAKAAGVKRFVQISALGADRATTSRYANTKLAGEKLVQTVFPGATILRPSVVFGPNDNFFNQFACMATLAPALPLIGGGHTKFQPVYVLDVARAVLAAIESPKAPGQVYELGGPRVYTFKELLRYILTLTGRSATLVPVPFAAASLMGRFASLLPKPPLTNDQVRLLRFDNIVSPEAKGFKDLGITPVAAELIVPEYLARFKKR